VNILRDEPWDSAHRRSSAAGINAAGMKPSLDTPMLCIGELRRLHLSVGIFVYLRDVLYLIILLLALERPI